MGKSKNKENRRNVLNHLTHEDYVKFNKDELNDYEKNLKRIEEISEATQDGKNTHTNDGREKSLAKFIFHPSYYFDNLFKNKTQLDDFDLTIIEQLVEGKSIYTAYKNAEILLPHDDERRNLTSKSVYINKFFTSFLMCPLVVSELKERFSNAPVIKQVLTKEFIIMKLFTYVDKLMEKGNPSPTVIQGIQLLVNLLNYNTSETQDYILQTKDVEVHYIVPEIDEKTKCNKIL
jgi:hypothetical protein